MARPHFWWLTISMAWCFTKNQLQKLFFFVLNFHVFIHKIPFQWRCGEKKKKQLLQISVDLVKGNFRLLIYLLTYLFIFIYYFLLEFNLPPYTMTPNAHPIRCPPQCPSPSHPHPPPPLLRPLVHFPELGVSHGLWDISDISHLFFFLSPLFRFTIFYIPQMNEII